MNSAKMGRKRRILYLNEPFLPFLGSQQNPLTQLEFAHPLGPLGKWKSSGRPFIPVFGANVKHEARSGEREGGGLSVTRREGGEREAAGAKSGL
jgi:hypothetical protein